MSPLARITGAVEVGALRELLGGVDPSLLHQRSIIHQRAEQRLDEGRRCGSSDVDQIPVDSAWAYVDNEEAADDPDGAQWGYFENTNFRCRMCHKEWSTAGEFRPYDAGGGPDAGASRRPAAEARVDQIWGRIRANASYPFFTKTGVAFTYEVEGSTVYLQNTNRMIPKSDFAAALDRFPVSGPGELQDLQGPSYLYAILIDPRIR